MTFWIDFSLRRKIVLAAAVLSVLLAVFAAAEWQVWRLSETGSRLTRYEVLNADIQRDFEDASMSLLSPYHEAGSASRAGSQAEMIQAAQQVRSMRTLYELNYLHYQHAPLPNSLKQLIGENHHIAMQWYDLAENQYFPALIQGRRDEALHILRDRMEPTFQDSLSARNFFLAKTRDWSQQNESKSALWQRRTAHTIIAVIAGVLIILLALSVVSVALRIQDRMREHAETTMHAYERQLMAFLESPTFVSFLKDADGRYVFINQKAAEAFRRPPDEILGKTDFELVAPELAEEYRLHDLEVLRDGKQRENVESGYDEQGNSIFWLSSKFRYVDSDDKSFCGGLAFDITDRIRAQENLNAVMESSPDMIWSVDRQGGLLTFNQAFRVYWEKTYRTPLEQGMILTQYTQDEKRKEYWKRLQERALLEGTLRDEFEIIPGLFVEITLAPIRFNERITGFSVFARDVTEKRQTHMALAERNRQLIETERSLRDSEARLLAFLDNPTAIAFLKDEEGRFVFVSSHMARYFGIEVDEFLGKTVLDLWPAEISRPLHEHDQQVRAAGRMQEFLERHIAPDGTTVWWQTSKFLFTDKANRQFLGGLGVNVTARVRAEEELRSHKDNLEELVKDRTALLEAAVEQANTANRAKSAFLANMSHELRTPLTSIIGFSRILSDSETLSNDQKRHVEIINRSGNHLLALINDVLELSRIEAGRMKLAVQPVDPGRLLRECVDMMRVRAESRGLDLSLQSTDLPACILTDANKLRQVILNLLSNAIKFTDRGSVLLQASASREDLERVLIHFSVSDTGVGIEEADQERIFDPFVQTGEADRHVGTGLGLSLSRQFVRMLGGELKLRSTPGRGSNFHFDLSAPLCVESPRPSAASGKVLGIESGGLGHSILVAEDNPETRLLIRTILTPLGFQFSEVEDGPSAVAALQSNVPDLIIMDWRLPGMDGIQATRIIRSMSSIRQPRILMVTASAFEEDKQIALEAGVDDFLRKPFHPDALFNLLEIHLRIQFRREAPAAAPIETTQIPLSESGIAELPVEIRESLREAVGEINQVRLQELLDKMAISHPSQSLAIKAMIDTNQFQQLWTLLGGE